MAEDPKETAERRDEVVRRMLATPPKKRRPKKEGRGTGANPVAEGEPQ